MPPGCTRGSEASPSSSRRLLRHQAALRGRGRLSRHAVNERKLHPRYGFLQSGRGGGGEHEGARGKAARPQTSGLRSLSLSWLEEVPCRPYRSGHGTMSLTGRLSRTRRPCPTSHALKSGASSTPAPWIPVHASLFNLWGRGPKRGCAPASRRSFFPATHGLELVGQRRVHDLRVQEDGVKGFIRAGCFGHL
jgi:hypothetical protein